MIWVLFMVAFAAFSCYCGAVMATGRWNPWRGPGKRRLR